ncbi:MAG: peptidase caspase catalytic subunit p20 [Alphaproteobacteria bacterium]|nr:peptidase caspase catalytic subunit p20 [Alphaproteobacteria bacterium]
MRRWALVLSACFVGVFSTPAAADDAAECTLTTRNQPWGSASAIAACTRLVQSSAKEPRSLAKAFVNRCVHYRFAGKAELAIEDCTRSLALEASAEGYSGRGLAYAIQGNYERAVSDLTAAIKSAPGSYIYYLTRANIYLAAERYDEAVQDYTKSMALNAADAPTLVVSRAAAYTAMGKHDLAMKDYNVFLDYLIALESRVNGSSVASSGYRARAFGYLRAGKPNEALIDINQALARDKDEALNWQLRAMVYEALGRKGDAIADYRRALGRNTKDTESRDAIARLGGTP